MQLNLICMMLAVLVFTAAALVFDLRTRKIPNWLTVAALALALAFHVATAGLAGLGTALAGFGVGFGILFVLWIIGGGGGGDVKLMGALGAWLGPWLTMIVFIGSGVLALVGMVLLFTWRMIARGAQPAYAGGGGGGGDEKQGDIETARRMIPYALPVTVATWGVMGMKLFVAFGGGNG